MALIVVFFMCLCLSSSLTSAQMPTSTISAAPALLPTLTPSPFSAPSSPASSPAFSPAFSPDISPLFPSPGSGDGLSPTESSLPIIPSSPSPPNPDAIAAEGPTMAFPPFGNLPESSSHSLTTPFMLALVLVPFWFLNLSGGM